MRSFSVQGELDIFGTLALESMKTTISNDTLNIPDVDINGCKRFWTPDIASQQRHLEG
jgi:hypothetical protein